jgi:predicted Zn-dependent protease
LFEMGNIAVRQHRDQEAIPFLKKFLALQPEALAAHADLGRAYLHLGQFEEAAAELTRGLGADTNGEIHYELAQALNKLGRKTEAEAALKKSNDLRSAELVREQRLRNQ